MTDITIDHPHGFETTFSTDPESPAAPFLQRLSPKRFEDFYDIGLIPAHIPIDHLRTAREIGLRASARHFDISNLASVGLGRSPVESRRLIVARSKSKALDASAGAMADSLVTRFGYSRIEAELLAKKVMSFELSRINPIINVILGIDDLFIKSTLNIAANVHFMRVRNVVIYRAGKVRQQGNYFLLKCNSIRSESVWEEIIDREIAGLSLIRIGG